MIYIEKMQLHLYYLEYMLLLKILSRICVLRVSLVNVGCERKRQTDIRHRQIDMETERQEKRI